MPQTHPMLAFGAPLRRAKIASSKKLSVGRLIMDMEERMAQLMDEFWGADSASAPRTVDVYMTKLREKLSRCNDFELVTVRGLSYKAILK